jgi:hypothetical protein
VPDRVVGEEVSVSHPQHNRRSTDVPVGRLSFPLQMVVGAVFATATILGGFWVVTSGLRSDVRNINTLMEAQAEKSRLQRDLDRERLERAAEKQQAQNDAVKVTVDTIQKEQRLLQIEFQNFRQSMLTIQRSRP